MQSTMLRVRNVARPFQQLAPRVAMRSMSSMPQSGTWVDKELGYDT